MKKRIESIYSLSEDIRYVAIYNDGELITSIKEGVEDASSSDSDKYEELIINPTILTLLKQRGDIDCGGANFVLIRYGKFYQFVAPIPKGHASICIETYTDPLKLIEPICSLINVNQYT